MDFSLLNQSWLVEKTNRETRGVEQNYRKEKLHTCFLWIPLLFKNFKSTYVMHFLLAFLVSRDKSFVLHIGQWDPTKYFVHLKGESNHPKQLQIYAALPKAFSLFFSFDNRNLSSWESAIPSVFLSFQF